MGTILPTQGKIVSFVDREADIALAAKSIFSSRFHFGGKSAYATDIVFIHDAAIDFFKSHLAQLWIELSFSRRNSNRKQLQEANHKGFVTLQTGSQGAVIEVQERLVLLTIGHTLTDKVSRSDDGALPKFGNPTLTLCSMSSTETGIDLCAEMCGHEAPAAAFIFASPESANYLARHVEAQLTAVNHIPLELLVGPRIPNTIVKNVFPRYSSAMFQQCRPQFSKVSDVSERIGSPVINSVKLLSWANSLQGPLPDSGEKNGKRVDFFEQAIMTAAGISLSTIIAITVTLILRKRS